ncbi:MAG: GerMN domain-containing protein [Vicinamibacterales bacterium]
MTARRFTRTKVTRFQTPSGVVIAGLALAGVLVIWLLVSLIGGDNSESTSLESASAAEPANPAATASTVDPSRKIAARIFYVADHGRGLVGLERDVAFAADAADQAREIVRAQIATPESPLVSPIPAGTTLRALFLTPQGEAYVDLSSEVITGHPGGSIAELLTVYAIVHALTENLPAVTSVQILVDGREVDTLAGHVNLRRPFTPNPDWID